MLPLNVNSSQPPTVRQGLRVGDVASRASPWPSFKAAFSHWSLSSVQFMFPTLFPSAKQPLRSSWEVSVLAPDVTAFPLWVPGATCGRTLPPTPSQRLSAALPPAQPGAAFPRGVFPSSPFFTSAVGYLVLNCTVTLSARTHTYLKTTGVAAGQPNFHA